MPTLPNLRPLLLALFVTTYTAAPGSAQDQRSDRLREYLTAAADQGWLNASVLVAEQGTVLVDTAFGFANMELEVRNTPDTRFRVASVTKQFTAMAVMMLAAEGKGWFGGYSTQAYSDYMSQEHAAERILRDAKARPLDFEPGTQFHYSNSAYIALGFIIERASGMSYEEFLRTRIHEPLGMTLSGQDHSADLIANRAQGYQVRPEVDAAAYADGLTRDEYRNAVYQLMEPPQADAGLITTARDLYKWDQALYTEKLIPRALMDSLFTPGLGDYGYGWFIRSGPDGVTYDHSGGLPGFSCYIRRIPGTHRTIIVLGNLERLGRGRINDIAAILRGDEVKIPAPNQ